MLDLSSIEIEKSEDGTKTNITDADVLEQLTNLKKYVPNPNGIKPVWVKMKNGETDELIVARGTFANLGTGEFEICVQLNGYKLIVSIEFTQALNEDDEPIDDWYIAENDAKYLFTSDYKRVFVEDVKNIDDNILSTLQCGDVVIKHDESGEHAYVVSFKSDTGICLTYADASCVETQSYDLVDDEWVYNSQDLSFINRMEQIVDADAHNRFIEGDINTPEATGITKEFGKWSLSGIHLLIVLLLNVADETTIVDNQVLGELVGLPTWIYDKIYPVFSTRVLRESKDFYSASAGLQTLSCNLIKTVNKIQITANTSGLTFTDNRKGRIAFDLLIDNE